MANLNPVEVNIRASWALNCAISSLGEIKGVNDDYGFYEQDRKEIFSRAKCMLKLLDEVKAVIQPPMKKETGKSKIERKEIAKDEAEHSAGDVEILES